VHPHEISPAGHAALEMAFKDAERRRPGRPHHVAGISAVMTSREREAWLWWRTQIHGRKPPQWSDARKARHAAKQARDYAAKKLALGNVRPAVPPQPIQPSPALAEQSARHRLKATRPTLSPAALETLARYLSSPL